jgi:copper chaperone CopZ
MRAKGIQMTSSTPTATERQERELVLRADGMSCDHCRVAVTAEVSKVAGVTAVDVDLDSKLVRIRGAQIDGDAVVAAIDEAGYGAVAA